MRYRFILLVWLILFILAKANSAHAATTVTSFIPGPASVGRYQKYEATFIISRTFPGLPPSDNPPASDVPQAFAPYYYYDPAEGGYAAEGITIDAHITAPSGRQIVQPAFYYQTYSGSGTNLTPGTDFNWKIRFTPEEIGSYSYYIQIDDKNGTSRYPASGYLNFTSGVSNSKGFVRVSKTDPRFMEFDNGESFIPIGSGRQWWNVAAGTRSNDYISAFTSFGSNGINLTRVWDQMDGFNHTVEGHFDRYSYEHCYNCADALYDTRPTDSGNSAQLTSIKKGTQMNQRGGYEEDRIIEAAEQNGIYIELCSHGDPYWIWDGSIYAPPDGTGNNFNDMVHVNYWKRNFRYRVARWGYSTSILAWELWNEHRHILENSDVYNFYQIYGGYQQQTDPYKHLRTTSQGSQTFSPGFWSSGAMDIANYHDYMRSHYSADLMNDEVNFVQRFAWCLGTKVTYCSGLGLGDGSLWSGNFKPWVWGEIDVDDGTWQNPVAKVKTGGARIRMLHNTAWAGLFSPIGTSPLDWYWIGEDSSTITAKYTDRKAARAFFNGLDYDGGIFTFLTPTGYGGEVISAVSGSNDRVFGMRRADKKAMYLWIVDASSTWNNCSVSGISCSDKPTVSTNVTIGGLNSENYSVEFWNTHTGQVVSTATVTGPSFTLPLVTGLTEDAAVKIVSTTGIPSPNPSPSSSPQFTIADLKTLLTLWLSNQDLSYYPKEGKVNALDASYVIKWILP